MTRRECRPFLLGVGQGILLTLALGLYLSAEARATKKAQVSEGFVCGAEWITFTPMGLNRPPAKEIMKLADEIWTLRKAEILRAFTTTDLRLSYLYTMSKGREVLIYVDSETYWRIVECLN